jgi:hypothetical protein
VFKFFSSYPVCLTLNPPSLLSDNMRISLGANLPSSVAFQLLSFVSQAANCLIANEQKLKVLLYRSYSQVAILK